MLQWELGIPWALVWMACLAHVAGVRVHHEVFTSESTIALSFAFGLPVLAGASLRDFISKSRAARASDRR